MTLPLPYTLGLLLIVTGLLSSCAAKEPPIPAPAPAVIIREVPRPVYAPEEVIRILEAEVPDPNSPVWHYLDQDTRRKCAQERAMGFECEY